MTGEIKTAGRIAYEADLAAEPTYGDGSPRKSWSQLSACVRDTWERNPTPRRVTVIMAGSVLPDEAKSIALSRRIFLAPGEK